MGPQHEQGNYTERDHSMSKDDRDARDLTTGDDTGAVAWDAVFWDIGGVVLDVASVTEGHRQFVSTLVDERDLGTSVEDAVETWRSAVGEHFRERDGTEFRSAREGYAKAVAAVVGEDVSEDEWLPRFREVSAATISPNPGALEAIAALSEMDVHLGVISDVDTEEGKHILESFGVRQQFDTITTSEEVGRTKPDPAMFETALSTAQVSADRSLMIGDRYRHDVEGASEAGLSTIAYGADGGSAVDYRVEDLRAVPEIVRGERD